MKKQTKIQKPDYNPSHEIAVENAAIRYKEDGCISKDDIYNIRIGLRSLNKSSMFDEVMERLDCVYDEKKYWDYRKPKISKPLSEDMKNAVRKAILRNEEGMDITKNDIYDIRISIGLLNKNVDSNSVLRMADCYMPKEKALEPKRFKTDINFHPWMYKGGIE